MDDTPNPHNPDTQLPDDCGLRIEPAIQISLSTTMHCPPMLIVKSACSTVWASHNALVAGPSCSSIIKLGKYQTAPLHLSTTITHRSGASSHHRPNHDHLPKLSNSLQIHKPLLSNHRHRQPPSWPQTPTPITAATPASPWTAAM